MPKPSLTSALIAAVLVGLPASAQASVPLSALPPETPGTSMAGTPAAGTGMSAPEPAPAAAPSVPVPAPEPAVAPAGNGQGLPGRPELPGAIPPDIQGPGTGAIPALTQTDLTVGGITVQGENFETDPVTGLTTVTGNPVARRGTDELRATRMVLNPATRQVTAEGNVVFKQPGSEIKASRFTYNFDTREGEAQTVTTVFKNYFISAEQVFLKQGPTGPTYDARKAHWTTCDKLHPHYEYYSRSILVYPGQQLIARNTGFDLIGNRLVTLPKLTRNLQRDEENSTLYPMLGYNRFDGFYAERDFQLSRNRLAWVDANLRLTTARAPTAGIMVATPGNVQLVGSLFYRDIAENQVSRFLQVSRLPEVGAIWGNDGGRPRPGRFLPHQVTGVRRPDALEFSDRWRFNAQFSAGYFMQHAGLNDSRADSGNKQDTRVTAQAQAILPYVKVGPLVLNDLRLMARQNFYGNGDAFSVLGVGIGKQVRWKNLRLRVDRFDQSTVGRTPFLFDDLELQHEWRPGFEYTTPQFNLSYYARIRANRNSANQSSGVFDQVFAISKLFHCIEPRLSFSLRRREVFLEVRIPIMSPGTRNRPFQPRSQDAGNSVAPPRSP